MNPFEEALIAGFVSGMEKIAKDIITEGKPGSAPAAASGAVEKITGGKSADKAKKKVKGKPAPKGWFAKRMAELKGHGKGLVKGFKELPSKGVAGKGAGYRRAALGLLGGGAAAAGAAGGAGLMAALRKRKEAKETA